ncbi:hypothetical protein DPX39_000040000 [Trypanosoma brucei equiperdum]|uniref:Uncharacterized protein n=1 Tax=Trypanosoma brucei equiperdum TaxID=630700 RepID=A0A3L6KTZ8_9TRYP|nr:hypothetical protein DPX39_000040000 [Trypanosoma brucei equiperdum]
MESVPRNGKTTCGGDVSHLGARMGNYSQPKPAVTDKKGRPLNKDTSEDCGSSGPTTSCDANTAYALNLLRGGKGSSLRGVSTHSAGCQSESGASSVVSSTEHVQNNKVSSLPSKKRRRGIVGPVPATAASAHPGDFSPRTSSGSEEKSSNRGSVATSASNQEATCAANPSGIDSSRCNSKRAAVEYASLKGTFIAGKFEAGSCTNVSLIHSVDREVDEETRASLENTGGVEATENGGSHTLEMIVNSASSCTNGLVVPKGDHCPILTSDLPFLARRGGEGDVSLPPYLLLTERDLKVCCQSFTARDQSADDGDEDGDVLYAGSSESGGDSQLSYLDDTDEHSAIVNKLAPLSASTLRPAAKYWGVGGEEYGEDACRVGIASRICSLTVSICLATSDRMDQRGFASSSSEPPNSNQRRGKCNVSVNTASLESGREGSIAGGSGNNANGVTTSSGIREEERMEKLLYLRRQIKSLGGKKLEYFSHAFGYKDCDCQKDVVCMAASALAVFMYFSPLPLPLLEDICRELSISTDCAGKEPLDFNVRAECLAEKISSHFYPMCRGFPPVTKCPLMPQMQIHEHAPGRYTCTVDNAELLEELPLHRLISNQFSCKKIRWQAILMLCDNELTFHVWHRHSGPLRARMVIRSQDPKRKRRNNKNNNNNNNNGSEGNGEDLSSQNALKERPVLFLEKEVEAAPGELVGYDNFVQLTVALRSQANAQRDYRLYNSAEDRLTFQFALNLLNLDGTPFADSGSKKTTSNTNSGKGVSGSHQVNSAELTGTSAAEGKRRKEVEKAVQKLEKLETQEREALNKMCVNAHRQLMDDYNRGCQKAVQKKKERERKALLAKVGPNPELQRELNSLTQTVAANRTQVAKLSKEKAKEEENVQRLQNQIEEDNRKLEELRRQFKSLCETLSSIEKDKKALVERKKEWEGFGQHRGADMPVALNIPGLTATRHDKLAIDDVQSFLVFAATKDSALDASAGTPPSTNLTPQLHPAEQGTTGTRAVSPVGVTGSSINGAGVSVPLPRSAGTVGGGSSFAPPATGCLAMDLSWELYSKRPPFTTMLANNNGGNALSSLAVTCDASSPPPSQRHQHPIDISQLTCEVSDDAPITDRSSPTSNGGFTVTAVFGAPDSTSRFSLDANAAPYTPTPPISAQPASGAVPHAGFTPNGVPSDPLLRLSPQTSSPSVPYSGSSSMTAGCAFPEKPRYTYVSTPIANLSTSPGIGLFGIKSFGPSSIGGEPSETQSRSEEGLRFPTAQWSF